LSDPQQRPRAPTVLPLEAVEEKAWEPAEESPLPPGTTAEEAAVAKAVTPRLPQPKRAPLLSLFFAACSGLLLFAIGLSVDRLVQELFARAPWLGILGLVLAAVAVLALIGLIVRELWSLSRLARIDHLRRKAEEIVQSDERAAAQALLADLTRLYENRPETAQGRAVLQAHADDIIDGRDLLALAEQQLLEPLDSEAKRLVTRSARRVALVTTLSPRAFVDIMIVIAECTTVIGRVARLYGARPGVMGRIRLARWVFSHLAVTGGLAASDSFVADVVGHGFAARLSARLGEGVVNGLLTTRVGLAAMEVCRPLPFRNAQRPRVAEIMSKVTAVLSREGKS